MSDLDTTGLSAAPVATLGTAHPLSAPKRHWHTPTVILPTDTLAEIAKTVGEISEGHVAVEFPSASGGPS